VRINSPCRFQRFCHRSKRRETCVVIHVEKEEDVRIRRGDDVSRGKHLRVITLNNVSKEKSRPVARERGVEDGEAEGFGVGRLRPECER
jgi:hypothetical protein